MISRYRQYVWPLWKVHLQNHWEMYLIFTVCLVLGGVALTAISIRAIPYEGIKPTTFVMAVPVERKVRKVSPPAQAPAVQQPSTVRKGTTQDSVVGILRRHDRSEETALGRILKKEAEPVQ